MARVGWMSDGFDSHAVRLSNLNKVRLDAEEKLIINAYKQNVDKTRSIYIEQQKEVLKTRWFVGKYSI